MSRTRAEVVDRNLRDFLQGWDGAADGTERPSSAISGSEFLDLVESQFQARHLDLEARRLKERGTGYYTIGSAGHEGNAAVAAALRPDDPAFLHYRSGAFFAQRAKQVEAQTPIFDVLLSLCAAMDDPISGGRHKVFGSRDMWIPPQTSTIASQLPKAMGAAFAIDRARYLGHDPEVSSDAVVVCSFGDASLNHSTALGALNASRWAAYQHLPMPVVWVCEDNGLGISVNTPAGWVEETWARDLSMPYFKADGTDLVDAYAQARRAVEYCRARRAPVFLHLKVVRLLGHAGTDPELAYMGMERIRAAEARDPLLRSCEIALRTGLADSAELLATYEEIGQRVSAAAAEVETRPLHTSVETIVEPLAPYESRAVNITALSAATDEDRLAHWGDEAKLPENQGPEHLAKLLSWGLHDLLLQYPEALAFGEDVAKRGGVYGVTAGLWRKFGGGRVFNALLDEQSILGVAIGAAHLGFLPIPEIQYLAYIHNALDQIRGEASSLQFFSNGQFSNPMVVRVASFGYQKGFGGHFHNDNSIAALRDIPGVVIAAPSRGEDAVGMLRTCMALARRDGRVALFLEPIALYMTRDLVDDGDDGWRDSYPAPGNAVPLGGARVYGRGADLTLVSWSNGLWRSLRAADTLRRDHGVDARVVDLRWLSPLDEGTLVREAEATGNVLVVDEGRRTGGVSEAIITAIVDAGASPRMARYCGEDTFIPLGPAWEQVLPSEEGIVEHALALLRGDQP
ncbi:MAG: MFS transporter [Acidobacteria bacterium]|nr:MFS transporter [Acidobacteriota bacterium]